MLNKEIKFSTQIQEKEISLNLNKNYTTSITDFFEFEMQYFYRSYQAFKDFDKYFKEYPLI